MHPVGLISAHIKVSFSEIITKTEILQTKWDEYFDTESFGLCFQCHFLKYIEKLLFYDISFLYIQLEYFCHYKEESMSKFPLM